jgi:hypothetical protein
LSVPVSERMSSSEVLWGFLARFLPYAGHVEGGGDVGINDEARGCSKRRRWEMAGRLGFASGKKWSRGGRNRKLLFVVGLLYDAEMRLVTPSVEERLPTPRRSQARLSVVVHAPREDEDDPLPR